MTKHKICPTMRNETNILFRLCLMYFNRCRERVSLFMLALVGLPTLFPKLVEARTYAERMFRVVSLSQLNEKDRRLAIVKPVEDANCPIKFTLACRSRSYPAYQEAIHTSYNSYAGRYLIPGYSALTTAKRLQFHRMPYCRKLDSDFFAGRWAEATDRQRELLYVIAHLDSASSEFSVRKKSSSDPMRCSKKGFSSSHVNQMLVSLSNAGLIYKNRYGKYSFAVPLIGNN